MQKIRVLIVDDSITMQRVITRLLSQDASIEVIGTANNPYIARDLIKRLNPDVLLLDIEMPQMDGITFLKNIMRLRPMPVIMVSTYTGPGKAMTLEALAAGAVDCIGKPSIEELAAPEDYAQRLIALVKNAAQVNIEAFSLLAAQPKEQPVNEMLREKVVLDSSVEKSIIAIGASTGGVETIEKILTQLPATMPGIVIVQHISRNFSDIFAQRINRLSQLTVMVAKPGQKVLPGYVLIAPHESHLLIKKQQQDYICMLDDGEPVQGHKPSVDVLFNSLAKVADSRVTAILLTGMGKDGAQGLKAIQEAGGMTIAQDQQSSVIWGMPGEAVKLGAAQYVLSLHEIIRTLTHK